MKKIMAAVLMVLLFIAVWTQVSTYLMVFIVLPIYVLLGATYWLVRRGQRRREIEEARHREMLEAIDRREVRG